MKLTNRFEQGMALALGDTSSLTAHRRAIARRDTAAEAWANVGESLNQALTGATGPAAPAAPKAREA